MSAAEQTPKGNIGDLRGATRGTKYGQRLELRVSADLKHLVEQAAAYEGRSATDFVRHEIRRRAEEVVKQHAAWAPNDAERTALFDALRNPPAANRRLKKAISDYRNNQGT